MTQLLHSKQGQGMAISSVGKMILMLLVIGILIWLFWLKGLGPASSIDTCSTFEGDLVQEHCNTAVSYSVPLGRSEEDKENDHYCCRKKDDVSDELYNRWLAKVKVSEINIADQAISFDANGHYIDWLDIYRVEPETNVVIRAVKEVEEGEYCDLKIYKAELIAAKPRKMEDGEIELKGTGNKPSSPKCVAGKVLIANFTTDKTTTHYIVESRIYSKAKDVNKEEPLYEATTFLGLPVEEEGRLKIEIEDAIMTVSSGEKICFVYAHTTHKPPQEIPLENWFFEEGETTCNEGSTKQYTSAYVSGYSFEDYPAYCFYFRHDEASINTIGFHKDKAGCDKIRIVDKARWDQVIPDNP